MRSSHNPSPFAPSGREYLAIPGPSVMPDAVLRAMHRACPNIYEGQLVETVASLVPDLKAVARTKGEVAMYIGNGHAAWEAALVNVLRPGDQVLVPVTGRFGMLWAEMAEALGIEPIIYDFGKTEAFTLDPISELLSADKNHKIKAVLAVHVDTSSSVKNDLSALRKSLDTLNHPALLMADCIASLGCDRFEMDEWGVDVMVSACQKGLMVPPGMAFVFFNDKAAKARSNMERVSRYWDWAPRSQPTDPSKYWAGTAPTQHIYGLRTALDMILAEGIEAVWARHEMLAKAVWAACDAWSTQGPMALNVADPQQRSHAVTALSLGETAGRDLRRWVEQNMDLTLGIGLGMAPEGKTTSYGHFRIGHMGHINGHMILGALGGIETALTALQISHGGGALEAASAIIARGHTKPNHAKGGPQKAEPQKDQEMQAHA